MTIGEIIIFIEVLVGILLIAGLVDSKKCSCIEEDYDFDINDHRNTLKWVDEILNSNLFSKDESNEDKVHER